MNTVVEGNDLSGSTLDGRYRLIERLGEGAMGQVYIAHHEGLDHRVAVKVLHPWLAREEKHRKRFLREARAATRIKHPNVVEVLDCGTTEEDSVYLVMELLHGRDLRAVLQAEGALPWSRARNFLLQAVAALREAHRQHVIHRDIKPANCFVCEAPDPGMPERMKLLDFGIAKVGGDPSASATGGGKRLTQTGELVGTLAYMAPEFADGKPASVHTDMYALGIMAYQLLTGDVPFTGRNEFQVLARHLNEPPVRPRVLVPELPEAVEVVVLTLLAKKPELRFESMADVEQAMLAIPGDATAQGPIVVPRRDSSGSVPVVRRRESSKPPVGRNRSLTPSRPLEAESDHRAPPRSPGVGHDDGDGFGPDPDDGDVPDSDVWEMGEPIDFNASPPPVADDGDDIADELPGREWGTTLTVVLLVLLSAAAIASVVLRQRGIELHEIPWPWSDAKPESPDAPNP